MCKFGALFGADGSFCIYSKLNCSAGKFRNGVCVDVEWSYPLGAPEKIGLRFVIWLLNMT